MEGDQDKILAETRDTGLRSVPAHSLEAERWVLGGVLSDPSALPLVVSVLPDPNEFYAPKHTLVYRAILDLFEKRAPVDAATVFEELKTRGQAEDVGPILARLTDCVTPPSSAVYWAKKVRDTARVRAATLAVSWTLRDMTTTTDEASAKLSRARTSLLDATRPPPEERDDSLAGVMRETFRQLDARQSGEVVGVRSGYRDLDWKTNGFQRQELSLIAARPGFGKTSLAVNLLRQVCDPAHLGLHALFFALEAQPADLNLNMLCSLARIDTRHARSGQLTSAEVASLDEWARHLESWAIRYVGASRLSPADLRAHLAAARQEGGCDIAFVDYLQLMHVPTDRNARPRHEEVAEVSRGLKAIAVDMDMPIVAMAQLNRNAAEGRPRLSQLRESGSLEQDAALVLAISQGDDSEEYVSSGPVRLLVLKNRYGPLGEVVLNYDKATCNFTEEAPAAFPPVVERPRTGGDA